MSEQKAKSEAPAPAADAKKPAAAGTPPRPLPRSGVFLTSWGAAAAEGEHEEDHHKAIVAAMKAAHQKRAAEKLAGLPEPIRNRVKAARKVEVRFVAPCGSGR